MARVYQSFAPGEVICVQVDKPAKERPHGRAIWSLAPTDDDTEGLLREKIKGKMESAKLLGGIVGAGLGFVLAGFHDLAFGWSPMMDDLARKLRCLVDAPRLCVHALELDHLIPFVISIAALAIAAGLYCVCLPFL